ncbi:MAG: hypothetical protein ACI4M9_00925, partial [Succinivibrio sp.]
MTIKNTALTLFLFCIAAYRSAFCDDTITKEQGNTMITSLCNTYNLLNQMSITNNQNVASLKEVINKSQQADNLNNTYQHKDNWQKVKKLNQDSMVLLEASYSFLKQLETTADYNASALNSKAFEECLATGNCNFKKLNELIDEQDLNLCQKVRSDAAKSQQKILSDIEALDELIMDGESSLGLNSSIDTLSKITSSQNSTLNSLTAQISDLTTLTASLESSRASKKKTFYNQNHVNNQ